MRLKRLYGLCLFIALCVLDKSNEKILPFYAKQIDINIEKNKDLYKEVILNAVICLGSLYSQCFRVKLDFSTVFTFVVDYDIESNIDVRNKFAYDQSDTFKMKNKEFQWVYKSKTMKGYLGLDQMALGYNEKKDIDLLFEILTYDKELLAFTNSEKSIDGVLGLGLNLNNNNIQYSDEILFIQQLYNQNYVDNQVFYFDFFDKNKAVLNIGSLPDSVYSDYTHYGSCNVVFKEDDDNFHSAWKCMLQSVAYNPRYIEYCTEKVLFDYTWKYVTPPYYLIDSIWLMFSDQQYSDICLKIPVKNGDVFIRCYKDPSNYFNTTLTINDWKLIIPIDELVFGNSDDDIVFYFQKNNDNWILGYNYLKLLTVVFNNEMQKVHYYHPRLIQHIGKEILSSPQLPKKANKDNNNKTDFNINNYTILIVFKSILVVLLLGSVIII